MYYVSKRARLKIPGMEYAIEQDDASSLASAASHDTSALYHFLKHDYWILWWLNAARSRERWETGRDPTTDTRNFFSSLASFDAIHFLFFYSQFLKIGFLCNRNISSQKTRCIYFGARHSARVRVSPVEFHRLVNKTLMQTRPRTNTCSQWAARVACFNTHSHCTWHSDKSCYVQEFFISYESYELIGWGESMEGHQKPC